MSSFTEILSRMLGRVDNSRDKRQGSIIYDTLSPVSAELAQVDISNEIFKDQTYLLTATGINLDDRAADFGITRRPATNAVRIAETKDTNGNSINLALGRRFSTPNTDGGVNFVLIENYSDGVCLLECEVAGSIGNEYLGPLLPLFNINNLGSAIMIGTYRPAENLENDSALRARVIERINRKAYGGNVADYKEFTTAIEGVGNVKVFPAWNGGGTVLLSIVDGELNPATPEFIDVVQNEIDPIPLNGQGLGIAPIGHRVTVVTPTVVDINITATLTLKTGYTIPQLQEGIENSINDYIISLRREWDDAQALFVFVARINAAIIGVEGVDNVSNITINGVAGDLELTQTALLQQLPMLESVVLTSA